MELSSEGKSIDFVSVLKKLVAKGIYDEKQAKQMLLECANLVPSISQAEAYAKTVSPIALRLESYEKLVLDWPLMAYLLRT